MTERLVNLEEMQDSDSPVMINSWKHTRDRRVGLWEAAAHGHNQVKASEEGEEQRGRY